MALTYLLTLTIRQDAKPAEGWCRTVLQNDLLFSALDEPVNG
jgi:hypothetical protein